MANIYEKMQNARVHLKSTQMKPSGYNSFSKYSYFELADFQPKIIDICSSLKLCTQICFTNDLATLTVINSENPKEQISFTSPMSKASLKGCHDVQNLGAVQTYIKRYLYTNAFDITEHDALDGTMNPNNSTVDNYISKEQFEIIVKNNNHDYVKQAMAEWGLTKLGELKESQVKAFELKVKDIQKLRESK